MWTLTSKVHQKVIAYVFIPHIDPCSNLWEENVIECWLYDLCDYALKQDVGLTYRTIRVLEDHWGFDSNKDDIDDFLRDNMEKFLSKVNK